MTKTIPFYHPLRPTRFWKIAALLGVASLPFGYSAHGASPSIWNGAGTSDNWTDAANWGGNVPVPSATYDLQFDGTTRLTPNNDFAAGSNFKSITFNAGAGQFVIGGNSILLAGNITNSSSNLQTINLAISLNGNATYDGGTAGLKIGGQFSQNNSGNVLTVTNSVEFSGGMAIRPPIPNTGRVFTVNGSGTALFSGAITDGGTTVPALSQVVYSGSGTLTLAAAGNNYTGQTTVNSGTVSLTGSLTGGSNVVVQNSGVFSESTTGSISGGSALTFSSSGVNVLAGANSYTGNTTISGGTLRLNNASALGSTAVVNITGGRLDNVSGTAFSSTGSGAIGGDINFGNAGETSANNITLTGTTAFNSTLARTVTLAGTGLTVTMASTWQDNVDTAQNQLLVNGAGNTLVLGGLLLNNVAGGTTSQTRLLSGTGNLTFTGAVANGASSAAQSLTYQGSGTLTLAGTNTYTGATLISSGKLQLGNGGTTGSLSTSSAITTNGNFTINRSNAVVQGTDFSGSGIGGTGSFTQAGSGTTTFNATNTYTGTTTVAAGTLQIRGGSAIANNSAVSMGGGTLSVAGNSKEGAAASVVGGVASGTNTVGLGALTLTANSTLDFDSATNGNAMVFAGGFNAGTSVLTITNWTNANFNGTTNSGLSTDDRLVFNQNMSSYLGSFDFGGGAGVGISQIALGGGFYELGFSPVPEPATWAGGLLVCTVATVRLRRCLVRRKVIDSRL